MIEWILIGAGALWYLTRESDARNQASSVGSSLFSLFREHQPRESGLLGRIQYGLQTLPADALVRGEERGSSDMNTWVTGSGGIPVKPGGVLAYPLTAQAVTYTGGRFGFQRETGYKHKGLDLWLNSLPFDGIGTTVKAVDGGEVAYIVDEAGFRQRGGELLKSGFATRRAKKYPAVLPATSIRPTVYPFSKPTAKGKYSSGHMGLMVTIEHHDGTKSRYMHLSGIAPDLRVGTSVNRSEVIGFLGGTDVMTDRPHLHLEIEKNGKMLDPEQLIGGV